MPRIVGVDIPNDKVVWVALTYIYGIGRTPPSSSARSCGIDPQRRAKDLTDEELAQDRDRAREDYVVEGNLRRQIAAEHLPPQGDRLLPRHPPPSRPPGPRPAHPDQRPHPQGPAEDGRRQEERQGAALTAGLALPA